MLPNKKTLAKIFAASALAIGCIFAQQPVQAIMEQQGVPSPVDAAFNAIIKQQWNAMMKRHNNADPSVCADIYAAVAPVGDGRDVYTVADEVNRYINEHFKYISDREQNNAWQHVASPEEMCISRRGDCEDFAVLKYFMLRHLGVPANRLYVAGVDTENRHHAVNVTLDHAVLLLDISQNADGSKTVLLDNRYMHMKTAEESEYRFYQAINENGLWPHAKPGFRYAATAPALNSYKGLVG